MDTYKRRFLNLWDKVNAQSKPDEVKEESMDNDRVDAAVWIRTGTHEEKRFVRRHRSPNASDLCSIANSILLKQLSRLHFAVAPSRGYRLRQRRRVSNIPPVRVHPMPRRRATAEWGRVAPRM